MENKQLNFRTDLALERRDLYKKAHSLDKEIDGIETQEEENGPRIKTSRVKVLNEQGSKAIRKTYWKLYYNRY